MNARLPAIPDTAAGLLRRLFGHPGGVCRARLDELGGADVDGDVGAVLGGEEGAGLAACLIMGHRGCR